MMADPKKASEILREYFQNVLREDFLKDWENAKPRGESLEGEWADAGIQNVSENIPPTKIPFAK